MTDNQTDNQDDAREERQIADLLSAANGDLPPPDREFLARLREQSAAAVVATPQVWPTTTVGTSRFRKWTVRALLLATSAAALAAIIFSPAAWPADPSLADAFKNLDQADTLRLAIHGGSPANAKFVNALWVRQPDQIRSESIVNGVTGTTVVSAGRSWTIHEELNQATSVPVSYGARIPVSQLLIRNAKDPAWKQFLRQRPAEKVQRDGTDLAVYRYRYVGESYNKPVVVQFYAEVNTKTGLPQLIEADGADWPQHGFHAKLLAYNEPIPDEKFIVKETLTEDGRIGKVTDVQGIVSVKPVLGERWTPVCDQLLLKPGDWLRTDVRGANAVALRLMKATDVILGPGSLAEFTSPTEIRLHYGEIEIAAPDKPAVQLAGADGQPITLQGRSLYRQGKDPAEKLARVEKNPPWLAGFRGTRPQESIGSLVANIDGRNTPLTVGYHKVTVDIRDQIARTTIEESFVNHTAGTLEGVFHFPLPQDASISGFGMWIGNELVEADVVEKQRAREIYETILRERRDPGLLEWSGGNLFKARVFPIFGHSEKRIKITYTQVLPLKGTSYRYSYALQSELLKQHPLRELSLDVKVASVLPIKEVRCPTHPARLDRTEHAAHVEFSAQQYTPARDFEVLIETGNQQDVAVIPHRRGEDGYFMLLLAPPAAGGSWQRELLPNGKPLKLLLLADTSASLDKQQRAQQAEFVASLCSSLTEKDTLNLACCDVTCDWAFEELQPANEANIGRLREHLAARRSLGWTDLDKAFASALAQADDATHIIYLGDGSITTGNADPQAFVRRLQKLHAGKRAALHAVGIGNTFEPAVMRGIAACGGGSFRRITGEQTPQRVARELLAELAQPGLRDIKLEFHGLRVARVYPERLPNLPVGSQQIVLGRYLPEGRDRQGEVIVTAMQGEKEVRFRTALELKDAEAGNSFIPRLWARLHLDTLLEQGASEAVRQEIIALSEEYHIITPYTSLLVLESDEDRQRFKVRRRFQMRDGEKFFQEGRDAARFALMQQQMQRAADWRLELRRAVLADLARAGRDSRAFQPRNRYDGRLGFFGSGSGLAGGKMSGTGGGFGGGRGETDWYFDGESDGAPASGPVSSTREVLGDEFGMPVFSNGTIPAEADFDSLIELITSTVAPTSWDEVSGRGVISPFPTNLSLAISQTQEVMFSGFDRKSLSDKSQLFAWDPSAEAPGLSLYDVEAGDNVSNFALVGGFGFQSARESRPDATSWLNELFPRVPDAPNAPAAPKVELWPREARELAESLLRQERLAAIEGGIELNRTSQTFDVRYKELASQSQARELVSPQSWLVRGGGITSESIVQWCDEKQRGIYSEAFQLGRQRESTAADLHSPPLGLSDDSLKPLYVTYGGYKAEVRDEADGRQRLILTPPNNAAYQLHYLIDTRRRVVLASENRFAGEVTGTTKHSDFVEVGGQWWATKIESFDKQQRRTQLISQTVAPLTAEQFATRLSRELAGRGEVQFIAQPLPTLARAKQAAAAGKATFDEQLRLLLHFAHSQQWPRVNEHLAECEKLAAGKPGVRWLRPAIQNIGRRHEELRQTLLAEAEKLLPPPAAGRLTANEYAIAQRLLQWSRNTLSPREALEVLRKLRPIYARQPAYTAALKDWRRQEAGQVEYAGQIEEALALFAALARDYPRDLIAQREYAQHLAGQGEYPAAHAWLQRALSSQVEWNAAERDALREAHAQLLQNQGRYEDLAKYLANWIEQKPASSTPYQHYLAALVRGDRADEASKLAIRWLKDAQREGELPDDVARQLDAAVQLALGQGYTLHTFRIEPEFEEPLAAAALYFARHEQESSMAEAIMGNGAFRQTDAGRRVRSVVQKWLLDDAEFARLDAAQIARMVPWVVTNDPPLTPAQWQEVATNIEQRWQNEADAEDRNRLAQSLVQILSQRIGVVPHLVFLRRELADGPPAYRAAYASALFDLLLDQPWSEAYESESFGLLAQISADDNAAKRLIARVAALYRWTDRMTAARNEAGVKAIDKPEKLTRTQLREQQREIQKLARLGVADRLKQGAARAEGPWRQWLTIERLYLELLAGRELARIEAECWEGLAAKPPAVEIEEEHPAESRLARMLRERYLATLANLTLRSSATPELRERLLKYVDQGMANGTDELDYWREWKYRLLVGWDRPRQLAKELEGWLVEDPLHRWRLALGYLLAEQGSLEAAVKLFEGIELADELGPAAYRTLSDWYLALGRRDEQEQALLRSFGVLEENRLSQFVYNKLQPWQRSDRALPGELDNEVLLAFRALFAKSAAPRNYVHQLQAFYRATHDFRLLAVLADAALGHSAGEVYPFLQQLNPTLGEIRDEATADSLVERIAQVRARAQTPVDRRALDLLEALVERRAAELINQPGPHLERSLSALQRSFEHELQPGEPRLLADLLSGLGRISQPKLAAEQLRQLEALDGRQGESDLDRLLIAHRLAQAYWNYERHGAAIDRLEAALRAHVQTSGGQLIATANQPFATLIGFYEGRQQFLRGEKLIDAQLARPANRSQAEWLALRKFELYREAIRAGGETSLGMGLAKFNGVTRAMQAALLDPGAGADFRSQLIERACQIYTAAHQSVFLGRQQAVQEDLEAFAFQRLPPLLKAPTRHYGSITQRVAGTLHDLVGVRAGLKLLIERIEQEPAWLRYNNQDGWSQFANTLSQWRVEAGNLGDLEPRLLAIVLQELRRDLIARQNRSRYMYQMHYGYFWTEQADAFAREAEAVLAERQDSIDAVKYIASYFDNGLGSTARAAAILREAHARGILDEAAIVQWVAYLHRLERFQESIPLLAPLVRNKPLELSYRILLMRAYFQTGSGEQLVRLLDETDALFHQEHRWTEGVLAELAASTLKNLLFERSAAYYKELIPLHERSQPGRGIGQGTLSGYYANLARAHAGLKQTAEAVEAACGAIISWGPRHDQRQQALDTLLQVLRDAPNLDEFVKQLDRQAAETGLHNPVVRKSLGQVYLEQKQFPMAIAQLKLALEVQPTDSQTHDLLLNAYDAAGEAEGAIGALYDAIDLRRRDLQLYQTLGERLTQLERPADAERAYTSLIEMQPLESESHALLAEIRQQQDRWPEAIGQWQRVAELRSLEPAGLLKLAEAQLHEKQLDDARRTIDKLRREPWPERFNNLDFQIRQLEQRLPRDK